MKTRFYMDGACAHHYCRSPKYNGRQHRYVRFTVTRLIRKVLFHFPHQEQSGPCYWDFWLIVAKVYCPIFSRLLEAFVILGTRRCGTILTLFYHNTV